MKCWPGALFVDPLNRFFADGRIDTAEIEAATILLRQVEKEYAESKIKGKQRTDRESTSSSFSGEDKHALTSNQSAHTLTLPVVNWKGKALASSIRGFYDVELATPSCTCPDFCCRRADLPASHPARACKHIVKCLWEVCQKEEVAISTQLAALLECFYYIQSGISLKSNFLAFTLDARAVIISQGGREWIDVIAFVDKSYQRFGYNIIEGRWSYDEKPANWEKILAAIKKEFGGDPFSVANQTCPK